MKTIEQILTDYQIEMSRIADALEKHVEDCGKKGDRIIAGMDQLRQRLDKIEGSLTQGHVDSAE